MFISSYNTFKLAIMTIFKLSVSGKLFPFFFSIKMLTSRQTVISKFYFCRLVHSGQGSTHIHQEDLTFGTRTGTRKGVEAHMFRVETPRELANWSRSLVQGAHDAATLIKEINCGKSFTTYNWCFRLWPLTTALALVPFFVKNMTVIVHKNVQQGCDSAKPGGLC